MSERPDPHAADGMVGEHGKPDDHGDGHGHDDHGHGGDALGPIDLPAWGAAILGTALGGVVVVALIAAAS
jgi:hypothetical protein